MMESRDVADRVAGSAKVWPRRLSKLGQPPPEAAPAEEFHVSGGGAAN